ncbi:ArsR/SmtB family transcription factor [Amycolatopsis samaneae]|uniref:ArsR/SmtB family transcription factor n=1 Tax=Amycolatopsis samaneae TaxID=664691 RepID=A0ABW5G7M3_9PSEU
MLRIHFTAEDLGRVRIQRTAHEMWESVLSLQLLQTRELPMVFDPWRREVRGAVQRERAAEAVRLFGTLNRFGPYFPDFLTPSGGADFDEGLDLLRRTPARRLRAEITQLGRYHRLPRWVGRLARGEVDAVSALSRALVTWRDVGIAPFRERIRTALDDAWRLRSGRLAEFGWEGLVRSLEPMMRWTPPVLQVQYPADGDLHLEGRGLTIVGSFFCVRYPVTLADRSLAPTLVYPLSHVPGRFRREPVERGTSVAPLLGETRATILDCVAAGHAHTTGEIAARLSLSPPAVSHHTKVLREGGLIESRRSGPAVTHWPTRLGLQLLDGTVGAGV